MRKTISKGILFLLAVCLDVTLLGHIRKTAALYPPFDRECMEQVIRDQEITLDTVKALQKYSAEGEMDFGEWMFAALYTNSEDEKVMKQAWERLSERYPKETEEEAGYLNAVWSDIVYFPVPDSSRSEDKTVAFENSWMQSRTYGGQRGHEGTDIMASDNRRGVYPVLSVSDGVVEKMGWLPQGGYRIGVRSPHGAYFYYAHLSDYAEGLAEGDEVHAGELLAFMGDTGYSEVEGTTGNFDVHLHFGVYLNNAQGEEFAVNSYAVLQYLSEHRLKYPY